MDPRTDLCSGNQGIGYYINVLPVVYKMAVAAIARMQQGGRSSGKKKKRRMGVR